MKTALIPALAGAAGFAWLAGGTSLAGPAASLLLPVVIALSRSRQHAFAAALAYYLAGSVSIIGAVASYYGTGHSLPGILAWVGASAVLALPWIAARHSALGALFALLATALPPLGVIGWLSPLNAAGVLFPATGWLGLICTISLIADIPKGRLFTWKPYRYWIPGIFVTAQAVHTFVPLIPPTGWSGLQTVVMPARGDVATAIASQQALINTAIHDAQGTQGARVVVFPEAVLDDWLPGTRAQFAAAVPPGQTWLIGAATDHTNTVVMAHPALASDAPLTRAAGLLFAGNWQPWDERSLRPVWWQSVFTLEGQRVWAALCVEQLQPWTWIEAMIQRPSVVFAMSNAWWSPAGGYAPRIQIASTRAWAKLMHVPVVWAVNHAPA